MRTKAAWLFVVPFLVFARPTSELLVVGAVVASLGLLIRGWSAGTIEKSAVLAVSGPYAYTRNPLYLGSFILGIGLTMSGGHIVWPVAFVVFFAAVYVRTMRREGERLLELFGSRYVDYADHVPAFLPRLTPYRAEWSEGEGFEWSRYLKYREWEALLGVVAALSALVVRMRISG